VSERLYRVSKVWRAFFFVGGLGLVGLFAFGLNETLHDPSADAAQRNTVIALLCAFTALFVLCAWFGLRGAIAVRPESIRYRSLGRWREWTFGELAGFRIPDPHARALCILFGKDGKRKLTVSSVFERPAEIVAAIGARLPDLDLAEARAESGALSRDRDFEIRSGRTPADIRPVRFLCRALNAIALAVLLAVLLRPAALPRAAEIAVVAAAVLVTPAAWALRLARPDVVRLAGARGSQLPSLEFALVGGLIAPIAPAVRDYAVLSAGAPLTWAAMLSLAASIALLSADSTLGKRRVIGLLLFLSCGVWAYGSLVSVNGVCDTRAGQAYATRVVRKSESEHSNSVVVAPFGRETGETDLDVPRRIFDALSTGDDVSILVRPGALGFPWVARVVKAGSSKSSGV
jgi:hypothetical protein